jgi:Ser-tRNA(Ala) deacylase AlaX
MTELLCLQDARLERVTARVLACTPVEGGFAVVPDRTVLFPEGGGQPSDDGTLGGQPVLGLTRREDGGVEHLVAAPAAGEVEIVLDPGRRLDLTQQHSAQHLITAVALARFGLKTIAFHLGDGRSDVEFEADFLTPARLGELEAAVNEAIREARPVRLLLATREEAARLPVRSRRLPEGLEGPLRLVEIEGLDLNTCGGTHVTNTCELQAIKLLGTEKLCRGTRVFYLAGGRVLSALGQAQEREWELTRLLSAGPGEQAQAVARLQAELREAERARRALQAELAQALGASLAASGPVASLHRDDAGMDFARAVALAARQARPDLVLLLTGGGTQGFFLLAAPQPLAAALGPQVAALLGGRGGGGQGLYQGKAGDLSRRVEAVALLEAHAR